MNTKDRLKLYTGMLQCSYPLYLWTYNADMDLLSSTAPEEWEDADLPAMLGFSDLLLECEKQNNHDPVLLTNQFGIIFFGTAEWKGNQPLHVYILGPSLSGRDSHANLKKHLDSHDLPVSVRLTVTREIEKVPAIPSSEVLQYIRMLHFCVNGEYIDNTRIQYLFTAPPQTSKSPKGFLHDFYENPDSKTPGKELSGPMTDHPGIFEAEQRLLSMIKDGNPDYKKALTLSSSLSSGVRTDFGNSLRRAQNNVIVLLTLVSRAAIEGGLSPSTSYSLNDLYAERIEKCSNTAETSLLANEILDDYVTRIRNAKLEKGISIPVRDACDYIHSHVREKISIEELAEKAGYTEYYFSHKFQEEMGMTVAGYTRKAKMEEAARLLSQTNLSITEIANELSLGSRSSFFTAFRRVYGCSPSEYRQHGSTIESDRKVSASPDESGAVSQ